MRATHSSLADHLRGLTDDELASLVNARPDLALPAPADFHALAQRAQSPSSLARALDQLDQFTLAVLDGLRLSPNGKTPWVQLRKLVGAHADELQLRRALRRLELLAIVWRVTEDDATVIIGPGAELAEVSGPYPAGLGRPLAELNASVDAQTLVAELHDVPEAPRTLLARLAEGPPIGTVRDASKQEQPATPAGWLIERNFLIAISETTVELPRELGLALRGAEPLGPIRAREPRLANHPADSHQLDRGGAGQAFTTISRAQTLLAEVARAPLTELRAGGISTRDLKRLIGALETDERNTVLLLELCQRAQLLARDNDEWLPTPGYDVWRDETLAQQWSRLAAAWLATPSLSGLFDERDERGRKPTPLRGDTDRPYTIALRGAVLELFAELPPDSVTPEADVRTALTWRSPRRFGETRRSALETTVAEAAELGVLARDRNGLALTGYAAVLIAGGDASGLLSPLMPEPLEYVLVQPDFSVVAPGPLAPELAAEMELVGDVESSGGATVYRVTQTTLRRAFEAGRTAPELHSFFAERSRTPIPQALTYLIDDTARRHGQLRVGAARSYLRGADAATLATLLADKRCAALGLRSLAPTVVISPLHPDRVKEVLNSAGYSPAVEDNTGALLITSSSAIRRAMTSHTPEPIVAATRARSSKEIAETIAQLRRGDAVSKRPAVTAGEQAETDTDTILRLLQQAVRSKQQIELGFVDPHGGIRRRRVLPLSLGAGYLRAEDERTDTTHTFALHRVASVILAPGAGR